MTHLVNRETIFKTHKIIAEEISEIQNAFFRDDEIEFENCVEKDEYLRLFDALYFPKSSVQKFHKIITFDYSDLLTFSTLLAEKLKALFIELNIKNILILSHFKINMFGNLENDYLPLVKAYKQLQKVTSTLSYDEAFKISIDDLHIFINIAFWIERCDPSGPEYIFFFDEKSKFAFFLCKDGNVHTIEYEKEILNSQLIKKQGWNKVAGVCTDKFTEDGIIEGRELKF